MLQAPIPADDAARLQELRSYGLLDTPQDQAFDDIVALVKQIAGTPIGIISLVDKNRQWFKSCIGLDAKQTPRNISFCGHTILQRSPLIIEDALQDPRFSDNPLVLEAPHIRFYAGFPLISHNGLAMGSLCAVDHQPRQLSEIQITGLERLARLVVQQMQFIRTSRLLELSDAALQEQLSTQNEQHSDLSFKLAPQITSKEQILSMVDLMFDQNISACFGLLRLEFKDWHRIANALGEAVAADVRRRQLQRLCELLPTNASCGQLGDQEWLLLAPFMSSDARLCSLAASITEELHQPLNVCQQLLSSQVAVGVVLYQSNYDSAETLLADAAIAQRQAALRPGSHYSFVDVESRSQARQELQLESELRKGLHDGHLVPHFQPLFDLQSGAILGLEGLARWRQGDGTFLPPQLFLPAASQANLIGDLDLQMIRRALAQGHALAQHIPGRPMLLSLNLSGVTLENSDHLESLTELIDSQPLPPGWQLQLELLEESLQHPVAEITERLNQLHQRDVLLAIDDFGTGYSSLSRLNAFPFHSLKVDMSFVQLLDASQQPSNRILKVIKALADSLDLHTTAEGVETEAQRHWLETNGFQWGQGYLVAKPMPAEELGPWLAQHSLIN